MPCRCERGKRLVLFSIAILVSLGGCAAPSRTVERPPDTSRDVAAILAQSRRLSEAYVQGDIEALVSIYTPDGVAVPGNRDFVQGREALLALWRLPEGRTILRHAATPTTLRVDGDHAYDWGYFEGQGAQDGEPMPAFRGAYVIVWARGADGIWRIAADMWNNLRD